MDSVLSIRIATLVLIFVILVSAFDTVFAEKTQEQIIAEYCRYKKISDPFYECPTIPTHEPSGKEAKEFLEAVQRFYEEQLRRENEQFRELVIDQKNTRNAALAIQFLTVILGFANISILISSAVKNRARLFPPLRASTKAKMVIRLFLFLFLMLMGTYTIQLCGNEDYCLAYNNTTYVAIGIIITIIAWVILFTTRLPKKLLPSKYPEY